MSLFCRVMSKVKPVVISGPSGTGKSTLLKLLFKEYENAFGFSVSHTSRAPRQGEVNGEHYHFSSKEKMQEEIEAGQFIEHAQFSGNLYGTSKKAVQDVLDQNKVCVLDLEEQGVRSLKGTDLNPLYVFVKAPSMEELRKRLSNRGTETPESLEKRMATAKSALEYSEQPGAYDLIIVNDDLHKAYEELKNFLTKEIPALCEVSPGNTVCNAQSFQCCLL